MPSVLSHPVVPIALGLALGSRVISGRLLATGAVASVLPDLDVLAFPLGIPYAHGLGHRGASHSLAFAVFLGLVASIFAAWLRAPRKAAFLFVFAAAASHGLLDMLTNGGLGIALAWPVSDERFFFPVRVIEASPLSLRRFFSSDGAAVMVSELLWVWLPSVVVGMAVFLARRKNALGGTKALGMAAAAACLLLLSSCSPAEKPADDDRAMAERIEYLEMQADKLAAGTGGSCPREFSMLETGLPLRISMFYGYDNYEGRVHDRVNARSMSHVLTKTCRGKLSACGFSVVASSQSAIRLMRTLDGREVEINLFTSSLTGRSVKGRFYRELVESDIVFYMGHSRLGGGLEFNAQPGVTTLFNSVFRVPMLPVLEALRQRPTKLKMIGMFSCDSNKYFRRDFQDANPSLWLVLTTGDIYARPAEQASLGALDAVLSKKCARAFDESMMSAHEPNPGMTYLLRGQ